ncbi:PHP domain-containing protein [candidate division KSB1 bacterium]|nr:PHP domain-containing protein [candidate division KSB1 bacterium]
MRKIIKVTFVFLFLITLFINCSKEPQEITYATLQFEILDKDSGEHLPAKLIFIKGENEQPALNIEKQIGICAERNGFYTAFGKGTVEIQTGTYQVYASRGMEYSIDKKKVKIKEGKVTKQTWTIRRELNPEGFALCDFHFHTTNSDGKPTPEERVTSLVGEGVEFAVTTDHNYVTDLSPEIQSLGVDKWINIIPGNEYTTSVGHYNVYPLNPETPPFDFKISDARNQFGLVRALQKPVVLQVNHPRLDGLDYFGHFDVDPITGDTDHPQFSWDFNAMEIMNSLSGDGLYAGSGNQFSVWEDWINFLNKDFRPTGVSVSDAHGSIGSPVGMPGSYVMCKDQSPAKIDPEEFAENIKNHRVNMARGVFINITANEKYPVGSEFVPKKSKVELLIQVQAASWAQVDKVTLYGNGREVWKGKVKKSKRSQHYKKKIKLEPEVDTWYIAKAEGSQDMWPIVPEKNITPVGLTNPIWVDIDGDGFESERERVKNQIKEIEENVNKFREFANDADWIARKQLYALTPKNSQNEKELIKIFAFSDEKVAREMAYKRLADFRDDESIAILKKVKKSAPEKKDKILAATYLATLGECTDWVDFSRSVVKTKNNELRAAQIKILSLNRFQKDWQIIGPFPNEEDKGLSTAYGPENEVNLSKSEIGKNELEIKWQPAKAEPSGYINFQNYYDSFDHSVAYGYAVIDAPEDMKTVLLFGSDDGGAVWQNGKQIHYHFVRRGAAPGQDIIPVKLKKGENKFLVKVENGGGGSGFYFELLDPCGKLGE